MNKPAFVDCHVHSSNSFDGQSSVAEHCEKAVSLGLDVIAITDHFETGYVIDPLQSDIENQRRSLEDVRAQVGKHGGLKVLAGVELGQPTFDTDVAGRVAGEMEFDFVLASVHFLRDGRDFYYLDYHRTDPYEVYELYLKELLETVRWGGFDSLAHMTYPLRYIIMRDGVDFDEQRFEGMYEKILSALADGGKALEINTSGAMKPGGFTLPQEWAVRRFRELGGRYVTLGSDSHRADRLGTGIQRGAEIARRAGFDCVTVFERRQPVELRL